MKVIAWKSYEEADGMPEAPIGGLGGWFGYAQGADNVWSADHSWADYLSAWDPAVHEYAEALRDAIVERRLWESGDWHQESDEGVPMFDDGTVATFSFRAWGDLLAAVWTEQLGRQYRYIDFYYSGTPQIPEDLGDRCKNGVRR